MHQRLTRRELYDLAWSEPMRNLAKRFGISDVALTKTCRLAYVPTPPQGHWNKAVGKRVGKPELPLRPPGLDDEVVVGGGRYHRYYRNSLSEEEILGPVPPEPMFDESMEELERRIGADLPKVTVPKELGTPHPVVAKLLKKDDEKRARQKAQGYVSSWDTLIYDTPLQRRKLRLLSTIFLALAKQGCRADTWTSHPYMAPQDEFTVRVGDQNVRLRASVVEAKAVARAGRSAQAALASLRLAVDPGEGKEPDGRRWEDGNATLEQQARGIVLAVMLKGEQQYRAGAIRSQKWRVELKASTIQRLEKECAEAERKERERQAALEKMRVDDLLGDAVAFRQARDIRAYVEEAKSANADLPEPVSDRDMDSWAGWALAQADRIDPVRNGAFRLGRDDNWEK